MSFKSFDEIDWVSDEAAEFAAYWRSLAEPGTLPRQSQFNPADIPHLLPGVAIYELRGESQIVCRLMGTGMVEYFGSDFTDQNILDLWSLDDRSKAETTLSQMVEHPYGLFVRIAGYTEAKSKVSGISIGFPALDGMGQARRLLFFTNNIEQTQNRKPREDRVVNFKVESSAKIALS